MYNVRKIIEDFYWIGVNDCCFVFFENIYFILEGVLYNLYMLLDKEIVVFDIVDWFVIR